MRTFAPLLAAALLSSTALAQPLVVLDPGHEPSRPGAIGVCGKEEMAYNDELAAEVATALEKDGAFKVLLTRPPGAEVNVSADGDSFLAPEHRAGWAENPRLYERASLANRVRAAALISIHHDSTAAKYQEPLPRACGGKGGKRLNKAFFKKGYRAGFSVFVYRGGDQARYEASLKLARAIGGALRAAGRPLSNYHAEGDDCDSCQPIDAVNGVYHKNLAVLRTSEMPAVLIEAGLIVDITDEKAVNSGSFRRRAAKALRVGLKNGL